METGVETTPETITGPSGAPITSAPDRPATADPLETVIERCAGWQLLDLKELWRYRELLAILAWRDIKVRYKQTVLGVAWAVLQPLATMIAFSAFFSGVAEMPSGGVPYPLFVFAGLLVWFFFANAVNAGSGSVVGNQGLITKVFFPRMIIPLSAVGTNLLDLGVSLFLLLLLMPCYGVLPGWGLVLAAPILLLLVAAAVGVGTLLAALTVAYRDFRYVVPFAVQLWMFCTPAIYLDPARIGPRGQAWLPVNPVHGLIENFRNAILGLPLNWYSLVVSGAVGALLLIVGMLYFRRVERHFADVI